jgi:hypothetical protein
MATKSRPKPERKLSKQEPLAPFALTDEVKTYEAHLPLWLDREGQFVLIKGGDVLGFFPRYETALEAGYEKFGPGPFLVKQILRFEPIHQVGHIEI